MYNMDYVTSKEITEIFNSDDIQTQLEFIEACPPSLMKKSAAKTVSEDGNEGTVKALNFLGQGYAIIGPYRLGAEISEACFQVARHRFVAEQENNSLYKKMAGHSLFNWMCCLRQAGKNREIIEKCPEHLAWLEAVEEEENLVMLKLKRIEAILELGEFSRAEEEFREIDVAALSPLFRTLHHSILHRLELHKTHQR